MKPALLLAASLILAGGSGFLTSRALGQGSAASIRTVTVDVGTGATGPAGPEGKQGPQGPPGSPGAGGGVCAGAPKGYSPGILRINAAHGQVDIWTCLEP